LPDLPQFGAACTKKIERALFSRGSTHGRLRRMPIIRPEVGYRRLRKSSQRLHSPQVKRGEPCGASGFRRQILIENHVEGTMGMIAINGIKGRGEWWVVSGFQAPG